MATVKSAPSPAESHVAKRRPRFIIATPICDGHDVAAAAITRLLRREGVEAVYIGFNKSVHDIVKAAVEEDASAIALSTYNGGHMSFIRELLKEQRRQGIGHVPLFCGGGGTILAREVAPLERLGVAKVYRPPLGARRGHKRHGAPHRGRRRSRAAVRERHALRCLGAPAH